ncbi:MAG: hypothetical protein J2P13_08475 [Acidobacteria bacterium]|nr:hypothetical protein [Acidobacteriota bacterium]
MGSRFGQLSSCAVILLALATAGCARRYYDPDHNDYHQWNRGERDYYNQWVIENHMDQHRSYNHLSKDEQKRYWDWRHQHDHDRDHDRDHDHH